MDRTGYAAGTLAVRQGLRAPVPDLDSRRLLTMADMGMAHGEMSAADPHAGHVMPGMDMGGELHSGAQVVFGLRTWF